MKIHKWFVLSLLAAIVVSSYTNCSKSSPGESVSPAAPGAEDDQNPDDSCPMGTNAPTVSNSGGIQSFTVKPSDTQTCITEFDSAHSIYLGDGSVSKKEKLFLFLPGTGSTPDQTPSLLSRGAARGYHVIGLMYPNQYSVNSLCDTGGNTDLTCFGLVREETLTGKDASSLIIVDERNSVQGRLKALLKYLVHHRPNDGWNKFLVNDEIQWNLVSVAGHSQGGGHAAYLAKKFSVYRVGIYSAISDYNTIVNNYPSWFSISSQTPSSKFFGFIHATDTIANYSGISGQVADAWLNASYFNMAGSLINVDSNSSPYSNSQRLYTNQYSTSSALIKHSATLFDGYQSAWDYISFP